MTMPAGLSPLTGSSDNLQRPGDCSLPPRWQQGVQSFLLARSGSLLPASRGSPRADSLQAPPGLSFSTKALERSRSQHQIAAPSRALPGTHAPRSSGRGHRAPAALPGSPLARPSRRISTLLQRQPHRRWQPRHSAGENLPGRIPEPTASQYVACAFL